MRGRKPTATIIKLTRGNPGRRPLPQKEPRVEGPIERPSRLSGRAGELWDSVIGRAWWLSWADGPKALMWCYLQAEFEQSPNSMIAARIAQLRGLASDLALDPAARARLGAQSDKPRGPADKYFD
jgi:hypothetical protein